jgi:hypothetical protein
VSLQRHSRCGPIKDANWDPELHFSVAAGQFNPDISGADSESMFGLQLALNCPWFGPPVGKLRQHFNYNVVDGEGYSLHTFEINPRWYAVEGNLHYGAGPGFGYMWLDPDAGEYAETATLQFSAAVEYHFESFFVAAGTRYQHTLDQDINNSGEGMDNLYTDVKMGFGF